MVGIGWIKITVNRVYRVNFIVNKYQPASWRQNFGSWFFRKIKTGCWRFHEWPIISTCAAGEYLAVDRVHSFTELTTSFSIVFVFFVLLGNSFSENRGYPKNLVCQCHLFGYLALTLIVNVHAEDEVPFQWAPHFSVSLKLVLRFCFVFLFLIIGLCLESQIYSYLNFCFFDGVTYIIFLNTYCLDTLTYYINNYCVCFFK